MRKLVLLTLAVGTGFAANYDPDLATQVVLTLAAFSALDRLDHMIR